MALTKSPTKKTTTNQRSNKNSLRNRLNIISNQGKMWAAVAAVTVFSASSIAFPSQAYAAGTRVNVFRLNNGVNHFYTTSASERDTAIRYYGYWSEGTAFYAYNGPNSSAVPVYRLNNGRNHLYTTSVTERNTVIAYYGYWSEGIAFYAYTNNGGDSSLRPPIYRLNNGVNHFYTSSVTERNTVIAYYGYWSEGIAFYGSNCVRTQPSGYVNPGYTPPLVCG